MAKGDNAIIPLYLGLEPVTAAVQSGQAASGGKFVSPAGGFQSSPLLSASSPATDGGNFQVKTCPDAAKAYGVAAYDAASTEKVLVYRKGTVVPMVAGTGGVTAGQQVEVAAGLPVTLASGIAVGIAISTATATNVVWVELY